MKTNENWAEIVDTLHPYLDGSREKERYLKDIGNCLRFLGWRKTNGTMVSCPPEDRSSGKPDIVLLKRGKDAGLQAFPVMTESPGEMVYAMGLYIGDNIRLYYNAPGEKGTPACVLTAEIRVDDANGPLSLRPAVFQRIQPEEHGELLSEALQPGTYRRKFPTMDGGFSFRKYRNRKCRRPAQGKIHGRRVRGIPCPGGAGQARAQGEL